MRYSKLTRFQIGKNGVTDGVIASLNLALKNHKQARISVLKSATRNRDELKKMSEEIVKKISPNCQIKIIGYTIILFKKYMKNKK